MSRPLFSCVMPVKGPRPYMDEALESLRSQMLGRDLEIIIQDGDVEPDCGQSDALNKGFAKAKGEWLFWLNADDVLLPGALKKVSDRIAGRRGCRPRPCEAMNWIVGNELFIDADGRRVGASVGPGWHDWLFRHAVPHVNGPSAFFRRELFEKVGGFDISLHYCMDWDLWIKFRQVGTRYERVEDYLWAQRRWTGSKTQRELPESEALRQTDEVMRMLAKNGFVVTRSGLWKLRLWRMMNGNFLREFLEGRR